MKSSNPYAQLIHLCDSIDEHAHMVAQHLRFAQGIHPGIRQQLINIAQLLKRRADEARAEVPDIDTMSQKTDELLAGIETSLKRRKRAEAIAIPIR
ncbi:MAG: hypothetical protein VW405_04725 [Rhodospirillaceae bacterium]|jgi:hypothetical protein